MVYSCCLTVRLWHNAVYDYVMLPRSAELLCIAEMLTSSGVVSHFNIASILLAARALSTFMINAFRRSGFRFSIRLFMKTFILALEKGKFLLGL